MADIPAVNEEKIKRALGSCICRGCRWGFVQVQRVRVEGAAESTFVVRAYCHGKSAEFEIPDDPKLGQGEWIPGVAVRVPSNLVECSMREDG